MNISFFCAVQMIERVKTFEKILIFFRIFSNETMLKFVFRSYFFGATPHKDILPIISQFSASNELFAKGWESLGKTFSPEKPPKIRILRRLKLRGLDQNQVNYR